MTRLIPALSLLAAVTFAREAAADDARLSEVEERLDAVAVVHTTSVLAGDVMHGHRTYNEVASALVVDPVAGALPRRIELLGGRISSCMAVEWKADASYLVLLERVDDRWIATDIRGGFEVVGGLVSWPYDDSYERVPVNRIVRMLEARLEARLGRGRFEDETIQSAEIEPAEIEPAEIEQAAIVATATTMQPPDDTAPAQWVLFGASAVLLGFVIGGAAARA